MCLRQAPGAATGTAQQVPGGRARRHFFRGQGIKKASRGFVQPAGGKDDKGR
jgi:hypothetical protein